MTTVLIEQIMNGIFGGMYFILFVVCTFLWARCIIYGKACTYPNLSILMLWIMFLLRAVLFFSRVLLSTKAFEQHGQFPVVNYFIDILALPICLFYSTYTFLIVYWASYYEHLTNPRRSATGLSKQQWALRSVLVLMNVIIYASFLANITIQFARQRATSPFNNAHVGILCSLYVIAALMHLVFGVALYRATKRMALDPRVQHRGLKTLILTLVCSSAFFFRALCLLIRTLTHDKLLVLMYVYFLGTEIVPGIIFMIVFRSPVPTHTKQDSVNHQDGMYGEEQYQV
eukprot:gnl/Trimastix_PCT/3658.p1 GENE.gnl/Trimastix_PCT/3658~~gnl/Trimastix_PCT/3658.p1  ORF type:complete len:286 (+),score=51.03 gnl/Trimastix_PCT/3658:95-952(+)